MTQKELGYIELEWICLACGTKNPGSQRTCTSCGSPQPANVKFEQEQNAALIEDEKKLAEAEKGADIHCPFCGTRNPADATTCIQCGGDLEEGLRRESGQVIGAYQTEAVPVQNVPCPNCGTSNPNTNLTCSACGARLQTEPAVPIVEGLNPPGAPVKKSYRNVAGIVIVGLVILCVLVVIVYLVSSALRQQSLTGQVESVSWLRSIAILELGDVTRQTWKSDLPSNARVGSCEMRYNRTESMPVPNATEVCGTPYTKDTGSGYGQVVQDCQYQIYEEYCSYITQEWQQINAVKLQGSDQAPQWPQLTLSNNQRAGTQQETYTVVFQTEKGVYNFVTSDAQLFAQCQPGSTWTLTINGFNQVIRIEPR